MIGSKCDPPRMLVIVAEVVAGKPLAANNKYVRTSVLHRPLAILPAGPLNAYALSPREDWRHPWMSRCAAWTTYTNTKKSVNLHKGSASRDVGELVSM